MKLFIGIKIDDLAKKKINNYFKLFYENNVRGNYTKINNLHMTLVFLGETSEDKVDKLKEIIKSINLETKDIHLTKTILLREVLVCDVDKNEAINNMYLNLCKELKKNGFPFEERPLHPHVTLVRKAENYSKYLNVDMNIISKFDKITLFESKRINNELIYVDLGE